MVIPASNILGKDINQITRDELLAGLKVCFEFYCMKLRHYLRYINVAHLFRKGSICEGHSLHPITRHG